MEHLKDHVVEIIQWLWPPLADHLGYAINTEDHVDALMRATEGLKCKRKDIEGDHGEEPPRKRRKLMTNEAEHWISDLSNIEKEVDVIKSEFEQRRTILNGRCTDYFSRYKLGRRAVRMLDDVKDHNEKAPRGEVAVSPPRPRAVEKQESLPPGQSTSERTLEEIWQHLQDENSRIICVYGMGGIGKTTLMKTINNRLIGAEEFDIVLWVTVSKEFNMERIQKEIAHELCLDFYDGEQKSHKLFVTMKDMKYMLILDDLWEAFDLEEAGIPIPDEQNRCKIAITTRFIHVSNAMEADKSVRVNTLSTEESWNLFCDKAGEVARLPGIQPLAEEVATECGGLPLAIITVGRAMRRKDKEELWQDALRALRGSAPEIPGMGPKVFLSLKLSYDHLEDENLQHCFLYCALFPEDYNIRIRKLIRFWTMEGYIDNVESFEEASNKGHALIDRIRDACLLEEGRGASEDKYVKMHDLVRDLAIWITSSSPHESKFLVKARLELKVPPNEEMWEETGRISLMWNEIEELPIKPSCPKLVTLLLRKNMQLKSIPSSFFELMPKLQILELSYTDIESLPMSVSLLVNLRALILKCCRNLVELPPLGMLKQLQFVDLSSTAICTLPEDFGNLVKLKQLILSGLEYLTSIPHNVLSGLSSLEDLRLLKTYVYWGMEEGSQAEATLGEVATLTRLTTFDITIPNIDCLAHDVFSRRWQRFRKFAIHVGSEWVFNRLTCDNSVHIHGCDHFPHGIRVMITHAEGLGFAACSGVTRVSELVGDSNRLRQLQVHSFNGLDSVIDWREMGEGALLRLEWLHLDGLVDLKTLFRGEIPQGRLRNLRKIEVSNCDKLTFLFPSSVVERLDGLQELLVRSCDEMVEIVEGDTVPNNVFPQLRWVRMERLHKLTRIISSTASAFTNLKEMEVHNCPLLKKLPMCASIQKIKGGIEWWDALEWEDEITRNHFHQKYQQWIYPRPR